jgi:hypothetical protein
MSSSMLSLIVRVAPFAGLAMAVLDPTTLSQKLSEGVDILGASQFTHGVFRQTVIIRRSFQYLWRTHV